MKVIEHPDGSRKVEVFRRDDGTFGFEPLKWDEGYKSWYPYGHYACHTETAEDAEREARGRLRWLDKKSL